MADLRVTPDTVLCLDEKYEVLDVLNAGGSGNCYKVRNAQNTTYIIKEIAPKLYQFTDLFERNGYQLLTFAKDVDEEKKNEYRRYLAFHYDWEMKINEAVRQDEDNNSPFVFVAEKMSLKEGQTDTGYIKMQTETGESLRGFGGKYKLREMIDYMFLIIESVYESAHKKGYLHLDIKPDNLYFSRDNTIRTLDFGCSIKTGSKKFEEIMYSPSYSGTKSYASPNLEKINRIRNNIAAYSYNGIDETEKEKLVSAANKVSEKDDIYSIMMCFLYLLTGKTYYQIVEEYEENEGVETLVKALSASGKIKAVYMEYITSMFAKAIDFQYTALKSQDADSLLYDFQCLKKIVDQEGIHEITILEKSKDLLEKNKHIQQIAPEEMILPKIQVQQQVFEQLEEVVEELGEQENLRRHCVITGEGGAGKTSWLFWLWDSLTGENREKDSYIPIYVPLVKVAVEYPYPVLSYIYENYMGVNKEEDSWSVEDFAVKFQQYIEKGNKKYLLILDAYNEATAAEKIDADLKRLQDVKNITLLISTRRRNSSVVLKGYTEGKVRKLDAEQIRNYLRWNEIDKNYIQNRIEEILSNPMILTLFTKTFNRDAYVNWGDEESECISGAKLIENCFSHQLKKEKVAQDFDIQYTMKLFLPLLALKLNLKGKTGVIVTGRDLITSLDETRKYISTGKFDELLLDMPECEYDFQSLEHWKKCWDRYLSKAAMNDMCFLREGSDKKGSYQWVHESYKDWFVADGIYLQYLYDYEGFLESVKYLLTHEMYYTDENLDMRSKNLPKTAFVYELMGIQRNKEESSKEYRLLLRNLSYTYENLKDSPNAYETAMIVLEKFQGEPQSEDEKLEYSESISGLTYALTHLKDMGPDFDVYGCIEYAKEQFDYALSLVEQVSETSRVLMAKAKILGNLGACWLARKGWKSDDKDYYIKCLTNAWDMHWAGLKLKEQVEKLGESDETMLKGSIASSYTSLGTDLFYMGKYDESIKYQSKAWNLRKSIKNPYMCDNISRIAGSMILKSKGEDFVNKKDMETILIYLRDAANNVRQHHMIGEIGNIIGNYKKALELLEKQIHNEDIYHLALETANVIEEANDDLFFMGDKTVHLVECVENIRRNRNECG